MHDNKFWLISVAKEQAARTLSVGLRFWPPYGRARATLQLLSLVWYAITKLPDTSVLSPVKVDRKASLIASPRTGESSLLLRNDCTGFQVVSLQEVIAAIRS
jgi:hypothetical protein